MNELYNITWVNVPPPPIKLILCLKGIVGRVCSTSAQESNRNRLHWFDSFVLVVVC